MNGCTNRAPPNNTNSLSPILLSSEILLVVVLVMLLHVPYGMKIDKVALFSANQKDGEVGVGMVWVVG